MDPAIGYYVHHQGRGHLARALAIACQQPERFVLLGTGLSGNTQDVAALELASDLPDAATWFDNDGAAPRSLHYAPLGNAGIRNRMAVLANWIERTRPGLIVCDVSVEVAMLARLTATPTVYVRLNGNRTDLAHAEAFRNATALIAPFHAALDDPETPAWIRRKTAYLPGITTIKAGHLPATDVILVVNGAGGEALNGEAIAAAAIANPHFAWRTIGPVSAVAGMPANLTMLGWIADTSAELANAAIIVGAAGDGLVSAVIAAQKPFICLPQPRPFEEQHFKARRLQALGAAVALETWPDAGAWAGVIEQALRLEPSRLHALHDPDGARKAFDFLTSDVSQSLSSCLA